MPYIDLNVALGIDDKEESESRNRNSHSYSNTSFESDSVEVDSRNKVEEVHGRPDYTISNNVGCGVVDICVAMGLEKEDADDQNYDIEYSSFSDEADANGVDDISKKGDLPPIDVCSESDSDANSHEDRETSRKTSSSNGIHEGRNDTVENTQVSDEFDLTSVNMLANEFEKRLEVGSILGDVDQCYHLYCEYARLKGFSVRRSDQKYIAGSDKLRWKDFVCSCHGPPKKSNASKGRLSKSRRMITRSNCDAKIRVALEDEMWKITVFVKSHSHSLFEIDQTYLLRSSRKLSFAKQALLEAMHSSGISLGKACQFMEKMYGGVQNTGYIRKDAYNHFDKKRSATRLKDGDAMALIEFFNKMTLSDPFFYWKIEKDADDRIMHVFFRDSRSAADYKTFGDVLTLDTTGGTNRYKLACAPFVGMNHHRTNIMFGIGFLSDERTSSFNWLLDAFLESMDGVAPKVVFTDQCKALMNAVDSRFPNSTHRLCQWHINRNAMHHFGKLKYNKSFMASWKRCMNEVDTEEEFEHVWNDMMNSYEIRNKEWFNTTYGLRRRWASVFSNHVFSGATHATSRSELTNKVLKESAKSTMSLSEFIALYEETQTRWREKERVEDARCKWLPGQLVDDNRFLQHAATVYTKQVYDKFELVCAETFNVDIDFANSVVSSDGNIQYSASCLTKPGQDKVVVFNPSSKSATCSCRKWETDGLLCQHILKVYFFNRIHEIPEQYILKRWTKQAKTQAMPSTRPPITPSFISSVQFVHDITRMVHDLAHSVSFEARNEIVDTFFGLRERLQSIRSVDPPGSTAKKNAAKKKKKANPDESVYHDPKPPKKKPRTSKGPQKTNVGVTQSRRGGKNQEESVDIDLNS